MGRLVWAVGACRYGRAHDPVRRARGDRRGQHLGPLGLDGRHGRARHDRTRHPAGTVARPVGPCRRCRPRAFRRRAPRSTARRPFAARLVADRVVRSRCRRPGTRSRHQRVALVGPVRLGWEPTTPLVRRCGSRRSVREQRPRLSGRVGLPGVDERRRRRDRLHRPRPGRAPTANRVHRYDACAAGSCRSVPRGRCPADPAGCSGRPTHRTRATGLRPRRFVALGCGGARRHERRLLRRVG